MRVFARYRKAADPRTEILSPELLPHKPKRAKTYLYSDDEIRSLLQAALDMPYRYKQGALLPRTYYCLFGLLSVTGLRLGEALNLTVGDVDLDAALLTVQRAKHERSRLVPLHSSTCGILADYIARRQRYWRGRTVSSWLFVSSRGNQHDSRTVQRTFNKLSRQIGLRGAGDSRGPCLHDLRHSFASGGLLVGEGLPMIGKLLGHNKVQTTARYAHLANDPVKSAANRIANRFAEVT